MWIEAREDTGVHRRFHETENAGGGTDKRHCTRRDASHSKREDSWSSLSSTTSLSSSSSSSLSSSSSITDNRSDEPKEGLLNEIALANNSNGGTLEQNRGSVTNICAQVEEADNTNDNNNKLYGSTSIGYFIGWLYSTAASTIAVLLWTLFWSIPVWIYDVLRLVLAAVFLSVSVVRTAYYYFVVAPRTTVRYGTESVRQTMDIYHCRPCSCCCCTERNKTNLPLIVIVPGGGWMLGHKATACLMARALISCGAVVAVVDYRNYPCATVPDQVQDIRAALRYLTTTTTTISNNSIHNNGPVFVVGESAGGHLALMSLLIQVKKLSNNGGLSAATVPPEISRIRGFIGTGIPLDVRAILPSFVRHGLTMEFANRVFGHQVDQFNPLQLIQQERQNKVSSSTEPLQNCTAHLPPMHFFHGDHDKTVPPTVATTFAMELHLTRAQSAALDPYRNDNNSRSAVQVTIYPGFQHTSAGIDALMRGDYRFIKDICDNCNQWMNDDTACATSATARRLHFPPHHDHHPCAEFQRLVQPFCPAWMIRAALFFLPL